MRNYLKTSSFPVSTRFAPLSVYEGSFTLMMTGPLVPEVLPPSAGIGDLPGQRRLILPEVEEVGGGFHYLHGSVLSGAEDVSGYVSAGNHVSIVTYDGEAVLEWAQGC